MVDYVKRNYSATLNIARYIDSKPLSKEHRHARNPHKTINLIDVICSAIWYDAQQ